MSGPCLETRIIPPAACATRRPPVFVLALYGDELRFFQRNDIILTTEQGLSGLPEQSVIQAWKLLYTMQRIHLLGGGLCAAPRPV